MSAFGGKADIRQRAAMSAFDPKRTSIFPIRRGTAATTGKVIACYTHALSFSGAAMKKLPVGVAAIAALISTPVLAADMVTKAQPPVAPAPIFSWTGFYAGIALGAKWADTTWTTTSISFVGNLLQPAVDSSSPRSYDLSGFRWGGYAGYNWQVAPQWLWGVEADLAGANKTVTAAGIPGCSILCFPAAPGPGTDISSVKMRWDASLRTRVGYLVSPDLLAYVTGGIAWQDIETSATCQHSLTDPICFPVFRKSVYDCNERHNPDWLDYWRWYRVQGLRQLARAWRISVFQFWHMDGQYLQFDRSRAHRNTRRSFIEGKHANCDRRDRLQVLNQVALLSR
jgi:opacity protein-like surface antigen